MRRALLVPLLFLAASCKSTLSPDSGKISLADVTAHQATWNAAGLKNYAFVQSKFCNCGNIDEATVTVANGAVVAASFVLDGAAVPAGIRSRYMTVPELFQVVKDLIAQNPAALDVVWDDPLGYPAQISVNIDPNSKLDDFVLVTKNFVRGPAGR